MEKALMAMGLVIALLGVGGVIYGVYLSFTSPHMAILRIWYQSLVLIAIGIVLLYAGRIR